MAFDQLAKQGPETKAAEAFSAARLYDGEPLQSHLAF
jgi:hypothetical protein